MHFTLQTTKLRAATEIQWRDHAITEHATASSESIGSLGYAHTHTSHTQTHTYRQNTAHKYTGPYHKINEENWKFIYVYVKGKHTE